MNRKKSSKAAAVIDIGSNMIKMGISQIQKGEITQLDYLEYPLSLGHEVFAEGKISFESLRELSKILRGFCEVMEEYGVSKYRVVSTTALREAENKAFIADQLKIQNHMDVEVFEDDQEKTLIYFEILKTVDVSELGTCLISHIGAGSIGLAIYDGQQMRSSQNIPMGALKLHDMLGSIQDRTDDFYTVVAEYLNVIMRHNNISSLENIRNPAAVYRLFENTNLFTTVTATDRSGFSQCYNFPSEKARSSSGSEHHLLDHMHRQLSVVSACSPFFSPTAQGIFTEKNGN